MQSSGRPRSASGPVGAGLVVVAGLLVAVISVYLLINPGGLPTYFYIGYVARFVPLVFLGIVALVWPLLTLLLALVVMFGGGGIAELTRSLFPISPFWMLIALTTGAQIARNIHRNRAMPWGEGIILVLLALGAAVYDLQPIEAASRGILLSLLLGLALVVALGPIRAWRQIVFVVVAMYVAFALLELQLMPFLIPSWGSGVGMLREQFSGWDSSLRQATSLDWLFNMMAIFALGVAVRLRGWPRMVFLALFLVLAGSSILTFSRGAYLGLGAGIVALLLVERRGSYRGFMWVAVAIGLVAAVAYYSGAWTFNYDVRGLDREVQAFQSGETTRLALLWDGVKEMPQHILIGRGAVGTPAHSALLDIWNNYGGVFAVGIMSFLFVLFRRSYRMAKAAPEATSSPGGRAIALGLYCSFAAAIANSLLDPTFFSLTFAVVFWVMRGLELAIWKSGLIAVSSLGRRTNYRTIHSQPGGTQVSGQGAAGAGQPFS